MPAGNGGLGELRDLGRRPKASKEGNRGKWWAVVQLALWGIEHGGRGVRGQPMRLSALVGDIVAHDEPAVGG